ncbi:MAG: hypothetical protein GC136_07805 [Alphaproteobacteria bacterium]|nr:hypothetical protein [Alphaproteobacteria bacterium]
MLNPLMHARAQNAPAYIPVFDYIGAANVPAHIAAANFSQFTQGTLVFEYDDPAVRTAAANQGVLYIGDTTANNFYFIQKKTSPAGSMNPWTRSGGVNGVNNFVQADTFNHGRVKVAIAWNGTDVKFYINGLLFCHDTNVTAPVIFNDGVRIGTGANGGSTLAGITKQRLRYYNGQLPTSELRKLTRVETIISGASYNNDMNVVAFLGQSNASGQGNIGSVPTYTNTSLMKLIGNDGVLKSYADPFDATASAILPRLSDGTAPALSYAGRVIDLVAGATGKTTAAVPVTLPTTSIVSDWTPEFAAATNRKTYGAVLFAAVHQLRMAKQHGRMKAIVYHQGERDAALATSSANYAAHLQLVCRELQRECPGVPIYIISLHTWHSGTGATETNWNNIQTAQNNFVMAGVSVIPAAGKSVISGTEVHLDAAGLISLGDDIAAAIIG